MAGLNNFVVNKIDFTISICTSSRVNLDIIISMHSFGYCQTNSLILINSEKIFVCDASSAESVMEFVIVGMSSQNFSK